MTVVCLLADPPREGLALPELVASSPLSAAEARDLYAAMTKDVVRAAANSGGELLVNYRADDALPVAGEGSAAELRGLVAETLGGTGDVRFEVQVGETFAGRAGNTVTHLLDAEGEGSAAVVTPHAAFIGRTQIDNAAMKLRRTPVVLGPAPEGRVYYAAFRETVDFTGAYDPPALSSLTAKATDADVEVGFLERLPVIETGADLADALVYLRARERAGRIVPQHTLACVDDLGLDVDAGEEGLSLVRTDSS
jgi:hypothetical protein